MISTHVSRRAVTSVTSYLLVVCLAYAASAQNTASSVFTVVDSIAGAVGGVTVDRAGNVYVADFGDNVWRVKPDGRVSLFASGFYGASGNTIDSQGNLFQANFYGNSISRVTRTGEHEVYVSEGLQGPVGLVFDARGNLYVNNCSGNTISVVRPDRTVENFAAGSPLNCPNGLTIDSDGNLYVVNFRDEKMLKVSPEGELSEFATLPGGGNGHVTIARESLIATSFRGQRIYQVSMDGEVSLLAGSGQLGEVDGPGTEATFSWPNGIAAGPSGDRVYINDYVNRFPPTITFPPVPRSSLRMVKFPSIADILAEGLRSGGPEAMTAAYRAFKSSPATASTFTEIDVNRFGYQLLQNGQLQAAVEVFKLNAESYPNSFNVYDSLAEAYMHSGQTEQAIKNYRKSLELNPANSNAHEMLRKLAGG